ncbi:cytochrome C assembly protein [Gordoniibacillus kamchatkensis]|uniref:Cytochrome C assembly protein n=1 Tax=Gordoniibacillus kamchatkensis TaxID=1590651 RepID=A0ABR5AI92_9BACL|nr:cytochrome c biogenesis protein CcsA [Paenibacillus sp. VKM B-2647]KIL40300.1 cytochrome C assembly protein [Paenibacillus sp. VKM B-2647]
MVTKGWLVDAILYLYALSLLFYFSDVAHANRKVKRVGTGLLSFVWVLQTVYLGLNVYSHRASWVFSGSETLFLFSWLLVTISLFMVRVFRIELLVFFINVFGFGVLALNFFSNPRVSPTLHNWNVNDELLFVHVSLAICSYAAFAVSAVLSGMYLFLHRKLKAKDWSPTMKRLPSLEKMDRYAYISVIIGAPLLLLALALGVVWIAIDGNRQLFLDPKVVNSLFVLAAYVFYLYQRRSLRIEGRKLAAWNLAAFVIVVINFIVTDLVSEFHDWIWMG